MTTLPIAHQRLAHQRLARPDLATPAEVAQWFGAVQAQELPGALYAVSLRMPSGATEQGIERAIAERGIVRTWPMRGTIHFVPAEDAQWMLRLLARRTNRNAASIYRRAGLDDATFARAGDVLARALQGGKVAPRKQLYAALDAAGIATDGEQRGLHLLGYWAREGLICLGPRQGKQPTFTLLDEWVPNARKLDGDEALATLARRYFTSHGPATEQDFAWWSGLTLTEARLAMRLVERDFERTQMDGQTYWTSAAASSPTAPPEPSVYLLPQYDEFTVAYKDRRAALHPAFPDDPFRILGPVIVVDGRVVGSWKRRLTKDTVIISVTLFTPLNDEQRDGLARAAERYGRYLGLPVVIEPPTTGA
ncbi:MAG TPA: winged helix DNA-binding domain-containing protein [Ktedonobacterales bacterium]|jgi:hypothetical protein|nr:winged helix DNA-binding domain-containing protein [Ktedonobacterales bacterium]